MSQYPPPPPYGPQGPLGRQPFDSGKDPLAPARRAALTLWIIGGLLFLGCGCIAAAIWVVPIDQIVAQVRTNMPPGEAQQLQGMNLATVVRAAYTGIGVAGVLVGLVMVLLAFFVFRGGRGAAITALVLTIPMALVCLILIAIAVYQGIHASPQALVAAALWVAILGLVGLL
ncbi:MAG TPA: hypothetical protein VN541_18360, partial [Tepidisphaeraceae bacterium]|nr:hypothetical protein [Tepidisphaeraceae bacterium]